ncbi:MAG: hypothetical protein MUE53_08260 [Chitinophagales bacterium]|nr:hypothetical protein [Chitinophagales bacterium]
MKKLSIFILSIALLMGCSKNESTNTQNSSEYYMSLKQDGKSVNFSGELYCKYVQVASLTTITGISTDGKTMITLTTAGQSLGNYTISGATSLNTGQYVENSSDSYQSIQTSTPGKIEITKFDATNKRSIKAIPKPFYIFLKNPLIF